MRAPGAVAADARTTAALAAEAPAHDAPTVDALEVDGLTARLAGVAVLQGISLAVPAGGALALLGANGAGKSTLLRALLRLVPVEGRVRLLGQPLDGLAPEAVVRAGMALVPEGRALFAPLTVEENLRVALPADAATRGARTAALERAYARFPALAERRRQPAGMLSGGEQKMLALARALVRRPRVLLLDEPSCGLAPRAAAALFELLARCRAEDGVALVIAEQQVERALALAPHALVLQRGRIAAHGASAELRAGAALRRAYFGA